LRNTSCRSLYVSEAFNSGGRPISNKIWRYTLKPDGTLGSKTLFFDFKQDNSSNVDVDGMRSDTQGNLYVTRNEGQAVVKFSPSGKILKKFTLKFWAPTNLELGGPQGKTMFVVGRCGVGVPWGQGSGCVQQFAVEAPGRAFNMLQQGKPALARMG
jgi:sugar lactone lactonase YvrE